MKPQMCIMSKGTDNVASFDSMMFIQEFSGLQVLPGLHFHPEFPSLIGIQIIPGMHRIMDP